MTKKSTISNVLVIIGNNFPIINMEKSSNVSRLESILLHLYLILIKIAKFLRKNPRASPL